MLFQVYPGLVPEKSISRYEPRIYGFRVHAAAALARWQDQYREDMKTRLRDAGLEVKYVEDEEVEDDEDDDEDQGLDSKERVVGDAASGRMDMGI